jgi:hypothetical protein
MGGRGAGGRGVGVGAPGSESMLGMSRLASQSRDISLRTRVARWYIFKPKIQIWVNFLGYCNGRCWYILCSFGVFYGHLPYFIVIWYIFWLFGIFFTCWYFLVRKIWQPCSAQQQQQQQHRLGNKQCIRPHKKDGAKFIGHLLLLFFKKKVAEDYLLKRQRLSGMYCVPMSTSKFPAFKMSKK